MDFLLVFFIAIGLAIDCFTVSITLGTIAEKSRKRKALKIGAIFGLFQFAMPLIGWALGLSFIESIKEIDHWIAFLLLSTIGLKMIIDSAKAESQELKTINDALIISLAFATSIDALAIGLSFAALNVSIIMPAIVIGIVTFVLSFFGMLIGRKLKNFQGQRIEIIGGIILFLIGIKILIDHSAISF